MTDDEANFAKEIDRLRRIFAELTHIRDDIFQPVAGVADAAAVMRQQDRLVRFNDWCRARGASPVLTMTRMLEFFMALGDPAAPRSPEAQALLDKTGPRPTKREDNDAKG